MSKCKIISHNTNYFHKNRLSSLKHNEDILGNKNNNVLDIFFKNIWQSKDAATMYKYNTISWIS